MISAAKEASQNVHGIQVSPEEAAVMTLSEGLILHLASVKRNIPIPDGLSEISFEGKKYKIHKDYKGESYFKAPVRVPHPK